MSRACLLVLCLLAGLVGCMEGNKADPLQRKSLAIRLGEKKVDLIVTDFITYAKEDPGLSPELKRKFESQNTETLKRQLSELIFGPTESSTRTTHEPLALTSKDFAALAPALNNALKKQE